jgi:hypothetical protein
VPSCAKPASALRSSRRCSEIPRDRGEIVYDELDEQAKYGGVDTGLRREAGLREQGCVQKDLAGALEGMEAVVFAVRHSPYLDLDQVVEWAGSKLAVIDCFGILDDAKIRRYFELGCEVKALGRGHIQRIKEEVRKSGDQSLG